jgi:hypothetical protein
VRHIVATLHRAPNDPIPRAHIVHEPRDLRTSRVWRRRQRLDDLGELSTRGSFGFREALVQPARWRTAVTRTPFVARTVALDDVVVLLAFVLVLVAFFEPFIARAPPEELHAEHVPNERPTVHSLQASADLAFSQLARHRELLEELRLAHHRDPQLRELPRLTRPLVHEHVPHLLPPVHLGQTPLHLQRRESSDFGDQWLELEVQRGARGRLSESHRTQSRQTAPDSDRQSHPGVASAGSHPLG